VRCKLASEEVGCLVVGRCGLWWRVEAGGRGGVARIQWVWLALVRVVPALLLVVWRVVLRLVVRWGVVRVVSGRVVGRRRPIWRRVLVLMLLVLVLGLVLVRVLVRRRVVRRGIA